MNFSNLEKNKQTKQNKTKTKQTAHANKQKHAQKPLLLPVSRENSFCCLPRSNAQHRLTIFRLKDPRATTSAGKKYSPTNEAKQLTKQKHPPPKNKPPPLSISPVPPAMQPPKYGAQAYGRGFLRPPDGAGVLLPHHYRLDTGRTARKFQDMNGTANWASALLKNKTKQNKTKQITRISVGACVLVCVRCNAMRCDAMRCDAMRCARGRQGTLSGETSTAAGGEGARLLSRVCVVHQGQRAHKYHTSTRLRHSALCGD